MALDRFGRRIHYLRISLTDHCNLRCLYCMPDCPSFRPNAELMQDEEILRFVRIFAGLGFDKIRLTGGEPTVRAGVVELVYRISHTEGINSLSMTTNGVLFNRLAAPLAKAGLQRVNFSLDTLDPARFNDLTRTGDFDQVWAGIQAAEDAGLVPIKINSVIVQDSIKQDIIALAGLTLSRSWQIRFIEMMPFAGAEQYQRAGEMRADGVKAIIEAEFGSLEKLNGGELQGEAMVYRIPGAMGSVGFIASVSKPFCESCSRARLTADGRLRLCLLREMEVDLLTPMREGASDLELRCLILEGIWEKPWGHLLQAGEFPLNRTMSQIGG